MAHLRLVLVEFARNDTPSEYVCLCFQIFCSPILCCKKDLCFQNRFQQTSSYLVNASHLMCVAPTGAGSHAGGAFSCVPILVSCFSCDLHGCKADEMPIRILRSWRPPAPRLQGLIEHRCSIMMLGMDVVVTILLDRDDSAYVKLEVVQQHNRIMFPQDPLIATLACSL